MQQSTEAINKN